jgi:amino acid transporter
MHFTTFILPFLAIVFSIFLVLRKGKNRINESTTEVEYHSDRVLKNANKIYFGLFFLVIIAVFLLISYDSKTPSYRYGGGMLTLLALVSGVGILLLYSLIVTFLYFLFIGSGEEREKKVLKNNYWKYFRIQILVLVFAIFIGSFIILSHI